MRGSGQTQLDAGDVGGLRPGKSGVRSASREGAFKNSLIRLLHLWHL